MAEKREAFSLVEAIIIVMFVGILAAIAVPRFNYAIISKHKAEAAAQKIVTDLRRTRRLAISDATSNTAGFALNMTGPTSYTGYEIKNCDTQKVVDSHTFDSSIICTGDSNFRFRSLGNLQDNGQTQLSVSAEGKTFAITIIPATGTVKCVEN
jgi:Tfp pilus assembly protein FimT